MSVTLKESVLVFGFLIFPLTYKFLEGRDIFLFGSVPHFQWTLSAVGTQIFVGRKE